MMRFVPLPHFLWESTHEINVSVRRSINNNNFKATFSVVVEPTFKNKINEGKQKLSWLCQESLLLF